MAFQNKTVKNKFLAMFCVLYTKSYFKFNVSQIATPKTLMKLKVIAPK